MKKIRIPHLNYTILVKDIKRFKGPQVGVNMTELVNKNTCILWLEHPLKEVHTASYAHEIVHALQFIAEARNIDFVHEQEHFGYLMQYILNEVMGRVYT